MNYDRIVFHGKNTFLEKKSGVQRMSGAVCYKKLLV